MLPLKQLLLLATLRDLWSLLIIELIILRIARSFARMTGGPGCSSILAMLTENGPCLIEKAG